ncbi:HAD family hydrolase [Staphylococcus pseudintermedius]|uniref:HAD family hydrolase n=1 Tax=Staphylococcus pseudintermedius TaxID=283734 RepID=UPI0018F2AB8F|nr:HAD family hydrolase [Staphylococcus pseudintermedius]EGQ1695814.1 HAD family hydrolase [Staphylococcus pseudintermedius]EHS7222295.1 HAD family hydrolase [Staphylococcus pseudintermedius]ELD8081613.1 HAD family hydrolase [Staphylococcus pseudintermedius]MBJ8245226.1 HAD family hydrolase [Staphylococcus pseudintermedius]MBJ8256703.1 HAD family hydrolase [Staphylococcus pseudintermedius]
MFTQPKLIIFDLDNTLYAFDALWQEANKATFESYEQFKGMDYDGFLPLYQKYDQHFWKQHDSGLISLDELRQLRLIETLKRYEIDVTYEEAQAYFERFLSLLLSKITVNEKMNALLNDLKAHVEIAILTNGKLTEQRTKIENLQLNTIFNDNIFISEVMGVEKPDAQAFLKVTDELNIRPEETLMVGDSWTNDVKGSINVGMSVIWFNPSQTEDRHLDNHQIQIFTGEIEQLLEKLISMMEADCHF